MEGEGGGVEWLKRKPSTKNRDGHQGRTGRQKPRISFREEEEENDIKDEERRYGSSVHEVAPEVGEASVVQIPGAAVTASFNPHPVTAGQSRLDGQHEGVKRRVDTAVPPVPTPVHV